MKKLLFTLLLLVSSSVFAEGRVIEFNLFKGRVTYQLNKDTGNLFGVINEKNGICLQKMDFKSKNSSDSVFLYEKNSQERGRQYYERFELNLDAGQVNLFTNIRNINTSIAIQKKDCSVSTCTNIAIIPVCNF